MSISSRALFHFTKDFKTLVKILEGGFWPRYCVEPRWEKNYVDFAIPMVCFCDIPLTQIKEHSESYGKFGIGVSLEWVKKQNSITPVKYVASKSTDEAEIKKMFTKLKNHTISDSERQILLRAKKVSVKIKKDKDKDISKKYYDEREWRYIPESIALENRIIPISEKDNFDVEIASNETKDKKLVIDISSIQYLIISNENWRLKLIKRIMDIYKDEDVEKTAILISKIISVQQINDDF